MIGFTLTIMRLRESDKSLGLAVELMPPLPLLPDKFLHFTIGHTGFIHCSLPSGVAPPSEVFVDALAF